MQGRYRSLEDGRSYTPNPNPNTSFRNFNNRSNNGYSRNNSFNRRPYLPPPLPSKQEILMRAGKLAAEYLVSQGLLDPEKLPHNRGQHGKFKDLQNLKYYREDDDGSENEADYGRSEYYRERKSGFDQLPARSENTVESRSENQDFVEDGGSKTSSLSVKKDASCEVVGDNVVVNSKVSEEVKSDSDNDSKKETIVKDDNNNGDDDDVMEAIEQESINIELKEEEKVIDGEEKSSNKRKREDDELPINNVKAKELSLDEEIDASLEVKEEKIEGEIDDMIEEEKQISSEPVKTCDLNLMRGPEVTENENRKELSMNIEFATSSNNSNVSVEFDKISNDDDDQTVQVSDIKVDVAMDGSTSDPSNSKDEETMREEPMYPNLDSFFNQHEHADLNGIHDGYSLEFPKFLGSDITRCPSVPPDLNNLGSGMEGVPNDDDSIYVSLGEIPIGFMEVWDPPAQDYGKFF